MILKKYLTVSLYLSSIFFPALLFAQVEGKDTTFAGKKYETRLAVYPAGGYTPETSFELGAFGVLLIRPEAGDSLPMQRPTTISPYFLFTLNGQFLSSLKSEIYFSNRFYVRTNFRYFNYPDLYFGTGINAAGPGEKYTDEFIKIEAQCAWIIQEHTFAGFSILWEYDHLYKFIPGGMLGSGTIEGSGGGKILGAGPYYRFDTRNNVLYPTKGWYIESSVTIFPRKILNDYAFSSFVLDTRYFTTLLSKKDILAVQAYYHYGGGSEMPFYLLPRLGGDIRLRGIKHENLYRDRNAFYFQFEGRRELFWRLGGVLFAGAGEVFPSLSEFQFKNIKYVYGIGGRFRPFRDEKLNLRLDIGKSPASPVVWYLSVGEAF